MVLFILFVSGRRHSNAPSTAHHTTKKTCVTHSSRKKGGGEKHQQQQYIESIQQNLLICYFPPFSRLRSLDTMEKTYKHIPPPLSLSFSVGYMYTAHTSIYTHTQKKGCVILRRGCYVVGCYPRLRAWPGVSRNWNVLPLQSAVCCVYVYTGVGQNVSAAGLLRIVTCKKRQTVDFFLDITVRVSSHQIGWLQSRAMYIREFVSRMMDDP